MKKVNDAEFFNTDKAKIGEVLLLQNSEDKHKFDNYTIVTPEQWDKFGEFQKEILLMSGTAYFAVKSEFISGGTT